MTDEQRERAAALQANRGPSAPYDLSAATITDHAAKIADGSVDPIVDCVECQVLFGPGEWPSHARHFAGVPLSQTERSRYVGRMT